MTLDGDVFDPAGTVTGGSRPKGQPVLTMMMKMKGARDELKKTEHDLKKVDMYNLNFILYERILENRKILLFISNVYFLCYTG